MRPADRNTLSGRIARAKPDEAGSGNPDPTMSHAAGSSPETVKGENMPPMGGEDIAPAGSARSPKASQDRAREGGGEEGEGQAKD